MISIVDIILLVIASVTLGAVCFVILRLRPFDSGPLLQGVEEVRRAIDRLQHDLANELAHNRQETAEQSRALREEVQGALRFSTESLVQSVGTISNVQQQRLDVFSEQLGALKSAMNTSQAQLRQELASALTTSRELQDNRLAELMKNNEEKLEQLRQTVDGRIKELQNDNATRLEEMRKTVDEKLQSTLEKRLSESFKLVSERLEQVHNGLGEMRQLANGVGDLKKVLTNVKTRGTWGEVQLGNLLEQILTPEQYARNVITRPGSKETVEFALKLPGRDEQDGKTVWLPIDAKFPKEDYERLVDAAERGDAAGVETAGRALEDRVKSQARDIRDKYIAPPSTTDFGLLYLPTEGLYAEVLRRPGMVDALQREYRVVVVGPTTLAALLNSLQMGFRTLAIQKRSSEVWKVLGAVKTEFGKFGDILERVKKKLDETSNTIDEAASRSRQLEKRLRKVEALPEAETNTLLADGDPAAREVHVPPAAPEGPAIQM